MLRFESNRTATSDGCVQAWKLCLASFWIDLHQTLQSQMKFDVWKECSDHHGLDKLQRALILDFKIFWAICLCKQSSIVLLPNHPLLDLEDLS